jgi:hypothetical protein
MSRIKHPNPQPGTFTDRLGGVVFHDGYAEVDLTEDPNLRDAYLMHGYEVEEPLDYLSDWTKAKLIAHVAEKGIDIGSARTKSAILAAIAAQSPTATAQEV